MKFHESILIAKPQELVFDYTQDYANRLKWDTFLKEAVLLNTAEPGKGVRAWCVSKHGLGMETEYVSFARPSVTAVKMTKGPFVFRSFAGSWKFEKISDFSTNVIFTYSFTFRFPFNLLTFFIKKVLQKNVKQRLVDLKNCLEKVE